MFIVDLHDALQINKEHVVDSRSPNVLTAELLERGVHVFRWLG